MLILKIRKILVLYNLNCIKGVKIKSTVNTMVTTKRSFFKNPLREFKE